MLYIWKNINFNISPMQSRFIPRLVLRIWLNFKENEFSAKLDLSKYYITDDLCSLKIQENCISEQKIWNAPAIHISQKKLIYSCKNIKAGGHSAVLVVYSYERFLKHFHNLALKYKENAYACIFFYLIFNYFFYF